MEEISYLNIHEYFSYQITEKLNTVIVSWDTKNKKIHELMLNEDLFFRKDRDKNCLWLNEVKRVINWKQGRVFYLYANINLQQSKLNVYSVKPSNSYQNMYVKIDEDGYLMVKKNILLNDDIFEKVNCVYNDLLDEEYNSYVLK